jgi:hypothetical protein
MLPEMSSSIEQIIINIYFTVLVSEAWSRSLNLKPMGTSL